MKDEPFHFIQLTAACTANDGARLQAGVRMLASENGDGSLNLFTVEENLTTGALSLTGYCFLKVWPMYEEIRKVEKDELELKS